MSVPAPTSRLLPLPLDALAQTRLALREFEVVMENAGVGIAFVRQREVIRCNQRYAEIYGYKNVSQLLGSSSAMATRMRPRLRPWVWRLTQSWPRGRRFARSNSCADAMAACFGTHLTGKYVNPANTDEGSIWIIDDIHEQKMAQLQLEAMTAEQGLILDNAMVGIVFLRDRKVTRCNRNFEMVFGYEPGELDGSSSRQWYLSDEDWEAAGQQCYAPLAAGLAFEGEMLFAHQGWCTAVLRGARQGD